MVENIRYVLRKVKKRWVTLLFGLFVLGFLVGLASIERERIGLTGEIIKSNLDQTKELLSLVGDHQSGVDRMYSLVEKQIIRLEDQSLRIQVMETKIAELEGRVYPTVEELTGTILAMNSKVPPVRAMSIARSVRDWSKHYNLPPILVLSLMKRESHFDPKADSGTGAKGLMQVIAYWHQEKLEHFGIEKEDLFKINENVGVGCWILREYLDKTGSIDKALRSYVGSDHRGYIIDVLSEYIDQRLYRLSTNVGG